MVYPEGFLYLSVCQDVEMSHIRPNKLVTWFSSLLQLHLGHHISNFIADFLTNQDGIFYYYSKECYCDDLCNKKMGLCQLSDIKDESFILIRAISKCIEI